jgi:translation elongation factor EF-Tu-like GTPase
MKSKPKFAALLTFASTEKSGKTTPVSSGYRATIQFEFEQSDFNGMFDFLETELIFPGDVVSAEITLFNAETILSKLYEGQDFDFYEGEVLAGHGVVTKILDSQDRQ